MAEQVNAPPRFKDAKGREWAINPTLGRFDTILEHTGVDLIPDGNDVSAVVSLRASERKLCDVLWWAIQPLAAAKSIDRADFNDSLNGDVLTAGWGAIIDAIVFFTPAQRRAEVRAVIDLQLETGTREIEAMIALMQSEETKDSIQGAVNGAMTNAQEGLSKALETFATSSQAS